MKLILAAIAGAAITIAATNYIRAAHACFEARPNAPELYVPPLAGSSDRTIVPFRCTFGPGQMECQ